MALVMEDHVMSKAVFLLEAFGQASDPPDAQGRHHPLPAILTLAILSGARGPYAIVQFGRDRGRRSRLPWGSPETLRRVALCGAICSPCGLYGHFPQSAVLSASISPRSRRCVKHAIFVRAASRYQLDKPGPNVRRRPGVLLPAVPTDDDAIRPL